MVPLPRQPPRMVGTEMESGVKEKMGGEGIETSGREN